VTTKTIECVECGGAVPYGRLSCPDCGALLAAVSRSNGSAAPSAPPPGDPPVPPAYLIDPAAPILAQPEAEPWQAPWPPIQEPGPVLVARPYAGGSTFATSDPGSLALSPGAYVPPGRPVTTPGAQATNGQMVNRVDGPPSPGPAAMPTTAAEARAGVDVARFVEIAGWLVIAGSALAVLGFLLPWSFAVVGARGSGGYLDHWGLASPTHVLAIAGLLGVLALGVIRTAVPPWLRTGVLGLGLGALLIGLTWPYLLGPLGSDIGVLVTVLGGLALLLGGVVASWATRHAGSDPLV
jgi:hypothetical protein